MRCNSAESKIMFTQKRTSLKFIGAILFTATFLIGGFLINTAKADAATVVESFGVFYSLSPIISTTNTDGSITTRIAVGCAPLSQDIYDINTGELCANKTPKPVIEACKVGSGDIYDMNTGRSCASYIKSVLVGCGLNSGDLYDINTGKSCKNKAITTASISKPNTTIAKITPISSIITPKLTSNTTKTTVTDKVLEISPFVSGIMDTLPGGENTEGLSGRDILKNSLTASVQKAGSIITGPMSVSVILLILLILLGGGYGVYSFKKKDDDFKTINKTNMQTSKKEEVKTATEVKPINTQTQVNKPNPEISHLNASTTNTPIVPINGPISTPQMPQANISQNSDRQGSTF